MATSEQVASVKVEHPRCPYCHDEVVAGDPKVACLECMAWQHRECFAEQTGKCAACGRAASLEDVAPRVAARVARPGRHRDSELVGSLILMVAALPIGILGATLSVRVGCFLGGFMFFVGVVRWVGGRD